MDKKKHKLLSRPRWEFYQLKPEATSCVVRVSWKLDDLDRPMTQAWANEHDALKEIATEVDYILDTWMPRSFTALTEIANAEAAAQQVIERTEHLHTSIENEGKEKGKTLAAKVCGCTLPIRGSLQYSLTATEEPESWKDAIKFHTTEHKADMKLESNFHRHRCVWVCYKDTVLGK